MCGLCGFGLDDAGKLLSAGDTKVGVGPQVADDAPHTAIAVRPSAPSPVRRRRISMRTIAFIIAEVWRKQFVSRRLRSEY
ncbi:MAG: hypothetical protein KI785_09875 [Devosiaceae bacterium]|nr:hypothetical protein [Devosiaceae bacterium MH13]